MKRKLILFEISELDRLKLEHEPFRACGRASKSPLPAGFLVYDDAECYPALLRKLQPPPVQKRPPATLADAVSFAQAAMLGEYVEKEVRVEREKICATCDLQRLDEKGVPWCSACKCQTSNASNILLNLTAYKENLPRWGCKHSLRGQGKGWPLPVIGISNE